MTFWPTRIVRRLGRAVLSVIVWGAMSTGMAFAAEEILRFDVTIIVQADGVLDVTETIEVRAEGQQIRRGIFRDFPLTFVDDEGRSHRVSFDLVEIMRDGRSEPHHTESNSRGIRIYIGNADVFLAAGIYTYRIRYQTGRQIRFLPDHTELFWNVTGNDWAFPIQSATLRMVLPDGAAPLRWDAFTGRFGEIGKDFAGRIAADSSLEVTTARPLKPGEGFSVVAEIPADLVAAPTSGQGLGYWFVDNRRFIIGGLAVFAVLAFYLTTWNAVGRDPPKGIIIPLFHPPRRISPAVAGYIRDYGWSDEWRGFTAATLSLAVKGHLVFDDSKETIVLTRTRKNGLPSRGELPPGERAILKWVGDHRGEISIDSSNGESVASALESFKSSVESENRNRFFKHNFGYFVVGLAVTVVASGLVIVFGELRQAEIPFLIGAPFAGVLIGSVVVPTVRSLMSGRVRSIVSSAILVVVVFAIGSNVLSLAGEALSPLPDDFSATALNAFLRNSFPFVLVGSFAAMNALFYYLLRAPTAAGRVVMDQIEGLELYIRTAEADRMNLAEAPDLTTEHFERLLPYAVALKAEEPWSEAFADAFARAHPGEDVASAYHPAWHGGWGWSGRDFGRSMSSAVADAESSFASAVPAPKSSSSGFSGGGFSGGGGGGGGGW